MSIKDVCEVGEFNTEISLVVAISESEEPSKEMMLQFLDAFTALYAVVRPLWLELHFGYFSRPFPYIEEIDIKNDFPVLYLQEKCPPDYTLRAIYGTDIPTVKYVSVISLEEMDFLMNWYIDYYQKDENLFLSVSHLRIHDSRVKVAQESIDSVDKTFVLRDGNTLLKPIPVETLDHAYWVAGPIAQVPDSRPPISYEILNIGYEMQLKVYVSWSYWRYPGHGEFELLDQVLHALVQRGWKPTPSSLGAGYFLRDIR